MASPGFAGIDILPDATLRIGLHVDIRYRQNDALLHQAAPEDYPRSHEHPQSRPEPPELPAISKTIARCQILAPALKRHGMSGCVLFPSHREQLGFSMRQDALGDLSRALDRSQDWGPFQARLGEFYGTLRCSLRPSICWGGLTNDVIGEIANNILCDYAMQLQLLEQQKTRRHEMLEEQTAQRLERLSIGDGQDQFLQHSSIPRPHPTGSTPPQSVYGGGLCRMEFTPSHSTAPDWVKGMVAGGMQRCTSSFQWRQTPCSTSPANAGDLTTTPGWASGSTVRDKTIYLQDYQIQLMVLEQQNKARLQLARQQEPAPVGTLAIRNETNYADNANTISSSSEESEESVLQECARQEEGQRFSQEIGIWGDTSDMSSSGEDW